MKINKDVIKQAEDQKKYLRSIGLEVPTFINDIINNESIDLLQFNIQESKMPTPTPIMASGGHSFYNNIEGLKALPNSTQFNEFNTGGTHEQNPKGGVGFGNGVSVEEGETSMKLDNGNFIFSNRIGTNGSVKQMAMGGSTDPKKPKRKEPDREYISVDRYLEGRDRVSNYISSEGYLNLLRKNYPNPEKVQKDRLNNVKDIFVNRTDRINQGAYYSKKHPDNSENRLEVPTYGNKDIVEHEYLHAATDGPYGMTGLEKERITKRIKPDPNAKQYGIVGLKPYYERPEEFQARLGVTRMLLQENGLYDYNKEKFTKEHLNKLRSSMKKNPDRWNIQGLYDVLDMSKSDEDLIWLMNNIASNDKIDNTFYAKFGGKVNNNCGGPGQPPCQPTKKEIQGVNDYVSKIHKIADEKEKYYNPPKLDVSSGNKTIDFLYKNDWLMDVPVVGDQIKNMAKSYAKMSGSSSSISNEDLERLKKDPNALNIGEKEYTGNYGNLDDEDRVNMIDTYFDGNKSLKKSQYKPSSDYLEFLPSYSLKGKFEEMYKNNDPSISFEADTTRDLFKLTVEDVIDDYDSFVKNKKPIYSSNSSSVNNNLLGGIDLGGHKQGAAWDSDIDMPYISVSDAWDFEPIHYKKKWSDQGSEEVKNRTYVQSYLMHKAGKPFKIYDRFYFDPKTKEYIPDEVIQKMKKKKTKK